MKAKELIDTLKNLFKTFESKHIMVDENQNYIGIYKLRANNEESQPVVQLIRIPKDATNFLQIKFDSDILKQYLSTMVIANTEANIDSYLATPSKKRGIEHRYQLCIGWDKKENKVYLAPENNEIGFSVTVNDDSMNHWSQDQLDELFKQYPNLEDKVLVQEV